MLDYMMGGTDGADIFVTRRGDGGSTVANADTIMDFEDGNDLIGLDGLNYSDLTIEQGEGLNASDVVVKAGDEYLLVIKDHDVEDVNYFDVVSMVADSQLIEGDSDANILLGGSGIDTINSGGGDDVLLGYSGDDVITIDGAGNKTIDGGPGEDVLVVRYSGINGVTDFTVGIDGDYRTLTNEAGEIIRYKNVETLTIDTTRYVGIYNGNEILNNNGYSDPSYNITNVSVSRNYSWMRTISSAFYSETDGLVTLYPFEEGKGSNIGLVELARFNAGVEEGSSNNWTSFTSSLTVTGTQFNDLVTKGDMGELRGDITLELYSGNDYVDLVGFYGDDTVDLGSGDDILYVSFSHRQSQMSEFENWSYSDFENDISLSGGAGNDWLVIYSDQFNESSGIQLLTITLNSGNLSGFENLITTRYSDDVTGTAEANQLEGYGGADTIRGLGGNDIIYGYVKQSSSETDGNDSLYGGAGDDRLYGGAGDDIIDGGTGADILYGSVVIVDNGMYGSGTEMLDYMMGGTDGADTFVTRRGDGGSTIASADTIMDFEDGNDLIGLDGLNYSDLTIEQGEGLNASDVVVKAGDEYLLVIKNHVIQNITDLDFTPF
jgi:Ca2+-binding RTX toxin-like protein